MQCCCTAGGEALLGRVWYIGGEGDGVPGQGVPGAGDAPGDHVAGRWSQHVDAASCQLPTDTAGGGLVKVGALGAGSISGGGRTATRAGRGADTEAATVGRRGAVPPPVLVCRGLATPRATASASSFSLLAMAGWPASAASCKHGEGAFSRG